ncbi:MAG: SDR family oxidoreductase [Alphaproteobacteria bacterium]|nr:SDR family oxidoreductase [Alphaproteobacteria bacterium]MCB9928506.1 SDR family oxidoreductase [Alphaproteobacteria bacterium]
MSEGLLEGKVVLVNGAGRGIGQQIAITCAQEGAKVLVNDLGGSVEGEGRDTGPAMETVKMIEAMGGEAAANGGSIANWDDAQAMVKQAVDTFGRIDGVVNVAGILRDRIFHKMTEDDFDSVINVHLTGYFYVARAAADYFRQQESGAMVHFTSNSGLVGNVGQVNYGAAKMGVVGLSKSIALDMSRFGVRSNIISPSAFTRMIETIPIKGPEGEKRRKRQEAMTPQKIAAPVAYLLSDAAKDVSGQIFYVRSNEIMLMSQHRPVRIIHRGEGWTPALIHEHAMPALRPHFTPSAPSAAYFNWDPV